MASYNPSFSRDAKGKFNRELGFVSIKGGTDAFLMEDELNEIQWIQNEARAELIRKLSDSGCLQVNGFNPDYIEGGMKELLHNNLNSFLLCGFDAILNGYLSCINNNSLNGNIITLPDPPSSSWRYDFIFLEFWFNEIKQYEAVKKFGGLKNNALTYNIIDPRMGVETSRRVQLQWNIRTIENVDYEMYSSGFTSGIGVSNMSIHPLCANADEVTDLSYRKHNKDKNLFISGTGDDSDTTKLKTIDGYSYAIPLFFVKRINSSGYDEINNPNGSINYVDNNSITTRPDGKFANIIYADQFIDVRPKAIMAKNQLDNIFVSKDEFNTYKILVDTTNTNILNEIGSTQDDINLIQQQVGDLINTQVNDAGPRLNNAEQRITNLQLDFVNVNHSVNDILSKVNNIDQRLVVVENELKKLGIDLTFTNLMYYGTDITFHDILSMGGQINTDGTLNCTGSTIFSQFAGYTNYSLLYVTEASPSGKLGDVWVEKADSAALFKNSGYGGIKVNSAVVKNNGNTVIVGSDTFNGMTGKKITHVLNPTDFLFITPTSNVYGTIGEIYYSKDATGFTVYNTGHANTIFDWIVIDTTQLRNIELTSIAYGGTTTITGLYGEDFKAYIGPSNIPTNSGTIGDVTISKSLNTLTVYNTGSSDDGSTIAQVLVFKEVNEEPA